MYILLSRHWVEFLRRIVTNCRIVTIALTTAFWVAIAFFLIMGYDCDCYVMCLKVVTNSGPLWHQHTTHLWHQHTTHLWHQHTSHLWHQHTSHLWQQHTTHLYHHQSIFSLYVLVAFISFYDIFNSFFVMESFSLSPIIYEWNNSFVTVVREVRTPLNPIEEVNISHILTAILYSTVSFLIQICWIIFV